MSRVGAPTADGAGLRRPVLVAIYGVTFLVVLPAFLVALGWRLDRLFGWGELGPAWRALGAVALSLGLAGMAWSMLYLSRRGRGLPISHIPPVQFVPDGPYARVRHPIYVAFNLAVVGAGLLSGSRGQAFGAGGLLLAGWSIYALGFEEPKLVRRFGESYRAYRAATPLLPVPGTRLARRALRGAWLAVRPAVERLANHVVLFTVGPTVWVTYGLLLAIAAVTMASITGLLLLGQGLPAGAVNAYLWWLAVSMLVGGRLVWLAYQWRDLRRDPVRVLRTVGFVSWGAVLASILFPIAYGVARGLDPLRLLDRTLLGLLACAIFGRIGCLTYGCCFGRPSPLGIRWVHPQAKVNRQLGEEGPARRVPTQLIASIWLLIVVGVVVSATAAPIPAGAASGLSLVLYAGGRFAGDCLRDEDRFGGWRLTAGQIGSTVAATLGFALLLVARGPPGWPDPAWAVDLGMIRDLWPAILSTSTVVFLVGAFHWRSVGRW